MAEKEKIQKEKDCFLNFGMDGFIADICYFGFGIVVTANVTKVIDFLKFVLFADHNTTPKVQFNCWLDWIIFEFFFVFYYGCSCNKIK